MSGKIHNHYEYAFALKVVKEVPAILKHLDKMKQTLYDYKDYRDVQDILYQIESAEIMLNLHLRTYEIVKQNKGRTENDEE